jgi:hypothetical protein
MTLGAGLPATVTSGGTSSVTTVLAPTVPPSSTVLSPTSVL